MNFSYQTMDPSIGVKSKIFKMEIAIPANFAGLTSYTLSKMCNSSWSSSSSMLEFILAEEKVSVADISLLKSTNCLLDVARMLQLN